MHRDRYVGFVIHSKHSDFVKRSDFMCSLQQQCQILFNESCQKLGICLIRFKRNQGIVKCPHIMKNDIVELLAAISCVGDRVVSVDTVGCSGTIRGLIRKHMNFFLMFFCLFFVEFMCFLHIII